MNKSKNISRKIIFTILFTGLLLLFTVSLIESIAAFLLNNSSLLTGNLLRAFRMYYMQEDRKIIQYLPECARYDSDLAYTLKPGQCHIEYREFEVDYSINSAGFRDDETSLISPEIIVAGDSHTMGWGVKQDLTFSSLLEKELGKSVLNAGVSSYGTVREMKILEKVRLDDLKYLIIQYNEGDFDENVQFEQANGTLPIMPEEKYQSIHKEHLENTAYYFGKHTLKLILPLTKKPVPPKWFTPPEKLPKQTPEAEVNAFFYALSNSPIDLTDITIIVFEVNGFAVNDSLFIDELNERIADQQTGPASGKVQALDLSSVLQEDKYYRLDDHMNRFGHQAIAESLAQQIAKLSSDTVNTGDD
jgi:hypothetical protein